MPRPSRRAAPLMEGSGRRRSRPAGMSHGSSALIAAWLAAGTIALLTGATAVVILLAVGLVAMVGGVVSGWLAIREAHVTAVVTAGLAVAGDELLWQVDAAVRQPAHLQLRLADDPSNEIVAHGWLVNGAATLLGTAPPHQAHPA
ncbi:MAG: hypothetical protein WCK21_05085, partial [Actinomycetota bacterium]